MNFTILGVINRVQKVLQQCAQWMCGYRQHHLLVSCNNYSGVNTPSVNSIGCSCCRFRWTQQPAMIASCVVIHLLLKMIISVNCRLHFSSHPSWWVFFDTHIFIQKLGSWNIMGGKLKCYENLKIYIRLCDFVKSLISYYFFC